ncbi:MAG: DUF1801 domain-containing protein [Bacteroidota bacterium]
MAKVDLKTKPNARSVQSFLARIKDPERKRDCAAIVKMMKSATGSKPTMWGPTIVGFGSYHYKYDSGREGDWFETGFSPRVQNLTLYIMPGFKEYGDLMKKLGKHKTGSSCLYVKSLDDVDMRVLETLIRKSVKKMRVRGSVGN